MDPTQALAETDRKTARREADPAEAAHWLRTGEAPTHPKTILEEICELVRIWEQEPEWDPTQDPGPEPEARTDDDVPEPDPEPEIAEQDQ